MAQPMTGPKRPTSAREARRKRDFVVDLPSGLTVRMRKRDLMTLVMENLIPLPLMEAMERLLRLFQGSDEDTNRFMSQSIDGREESMQVLRQYAMLCVIEPKLTATDDGNPDHLPVEELTMLDLMAIWNAKPPAASLGIEEVPAAEADSFREARPADDAAVAHAGEDVRPEPQQLAAAEYVGQ